MDRYGGAEGAVGERVEEREKGKGSAETAMKEEEQVEECMSPFTMDNVCGG